MQGKIKSLLIKYFKNQVGNQKFCIISNDCWGAEIYKLLEKPFNTPFIGLMLMGPCYIQLLEDLKYYLNLPLHFIDQSKYGEMQAIKSGINFPLGVLGDSGIEVHFLHYQSKEEAKEKWERRLNRMDWNHLFIKYDCNKDYADKELVERFVKIPHSNKIVFGKENFGCKEVILVEHCPYNAVKQFRSCFLNFNPVGWLKGEIYYKSVWERYIGKLSSKYL
jgi:uncharacterized protein (DUF1919 family)